MTTTGVPGDAATMLLSPARRLDADSAARAFVDAAAPHYASLARRLALVVGNPHDGEDLAQETYLRAYRAWTSFDGEDARAWLYTIGLRLAFNHRRRQRRLLSFIGRAEDGSSAAPSDPDLWSALTSLDRRTRAALLLNVVDGYTQAEIAAMLGTPEGTVSSWLSRGRAVLREKLSDAGSDGGS